MAQTPTTQRKTDDSEQSVYISDLDTVKLYPKMMTNDEIDFDIQTKVRGNSEEDYYVNFQPMKALMSGFSALGEVLGMKYGEFSENKMQPAMKFLATRPDAALGFPIGPVTPKDLEKTYKPWIELWREASPLTKANDKLLSEKPLWRSAVPWFLTEFVPETLLEFGTRPQAWVGAYGIEKLGPPLLNKAISSLPKKVREVLLKDLFASEKGLDKAFETLGVPRNTKTSEVQNAFREKAFATHPDRGGSASEFNSIKKAYDKIMKSRAGMMDKLFDVFRGKIKPEVSEPIGYLEFAGKQGQAGYVRFPLAAGDLVKVGEQTGQALKVVGNMATVNLAGKMVEVPLEKLQPHPEMIKKMEKDTLDPRNFKTAEEFVKASGELVHHGGDKVFSSADEIDTKKRAFFTLKRTQEGLEEIKGGGSYWTEDDLRRMPAKAFGENLTDFVVKFKNPKVIDAEGKTWFEVADSIADKYIKKNPKGYDGIILKNVEEGFSGKSKLGASAGLVDDYIVLDKSAIQTRQQLTDIWNKANKLSQPQGEGAVPPKEPPKAPPAAPEGDDAESAVNLERMKIDEKAKKNLEKATQVAKDEIENQTGRVLSNEEVIKAAKQAEILQSARGMEGTEELAAKILKTRQQLAALAEQDTLTPEFIETLKTVSDTGTDVARLLQSFKIEAMPEYATAKAKLIKAVMDTGAKVDDILEAAKGVDFKDEQQVATFYRKFVKPNIGEMLDEYAYINILSSPRTHIINTFSNLIQMVGLNPLTKLASGAIDSVAANLTGKERTHYVKEVPAFYKGALNAFPDAWEGVQMAMKGKRYMERPDVKGLPTMAKWIDYATLGVGKYVPRALEGMDVFFRTMIEAGEIEALSVRLGHTPNDKELLAIQKEARRLANYYVFRARPDPQNKTGQGHLMSAIDQMTGVAYRLREVGIGWFKPFRWYLRFVQTPMNILKQGVEYSPAGFANLPGSKDKVEGAAKSVIGSLVFLGGLYLGMQNRLTWGVPRNQKDKEEFYKAGMQPYSIKVGNSYISYSKVGPLAYPLVMAAALNYYMKDSPDALSDSQMDKIADALGGVMQFFSDQSYLQGIGDLTKTLQGDKNSITRLVTSFPTQMIPLSSLQGWINNTIDPFFRTPEKGLTFNALLDNLKKKIVGLPFTMEKDLDSRRQPKERSYPVLNAVSPVQVSKRNLSEEERYRANMKRKQIARKREADIEKLQSRRS